MLKTISPLISPELLKVLAEMGHGDEIIFPMPISAHSMGPQVIAPMACESAICCRRLSRCSN